MLTCVVFSINFTVAHYCLFLLFFTEYPYAEEVELRVYNDQQPIASTTFRFYQQISSSPEMLLHLLNSQLQSQFHVGSGAQGGVGGATGGGASGQVQCVLYCVMIIKTIPSLSLSDYLQWLHTFFNVSAATRCL